MKRKKQFLCEQYLGDRVEYDGTWLRREEVSGPSRTALASEWRRAKDTFRKRLVVHGKTALWWRRIPNSQEDKHNRWLITLADTCPYPVRQL